MEGEHHGRLHLHPRRLGHYHRQQWEHWLHPPWRGWRHSDLAPSQGASGGRASAHRFFFVTFCHKRSFIPTKHQTHGSGRERCFHLLLPRKNRIWCANWIDSTELLVYHFCSLGWFLSCCGEEAGSSPRGRAMFFLCNSARISAY